MLRQAWPARIVVGAMVVITLALALTGPSRAQTPASLSPMVVSGSVTLNGAPAAPGTTVQAFVGASLCGQTIATFGVSGSTYFLSVNSSTQQAGCAAAGATAW